MAYIDEIEDYDIGMEIDPPGTRTPRENRPTRQQKIRTRRTDAPRKDADDRATVKSPARARKPEPKQKYGLVDFLTDYRTHLAIGIFLCVVAIIMACVSVSFLFNGQLDQSVTYGRSISEIVNSGEEVRNAGGAFGAKFANFLMGETFGVGSFIIAIYLFILGLWAMHMVKINFFTLTFKSLYSAVAISLIVGLLTFNTNGFFHLGGNHGYYINDMLQRYAGALGSYAIALLLTGGLICIYLHPLTTFFKGLVKFSKGVKKRIPDNLPEKVSAIVKSPVSISSLDEEEKNDPREEVGAIEEVEEDEAIEEEAADDDDKSEEEKAEDVERKKYSAPDLDVLDEEPAKRYAENPESVTSVVETEITDKIDTPDRPIVQITNLATEHDSEHVPTRESMPEIHDGDHFGVDAPYDHRAELGQFKIPGTDFLIERPSAVTFSQAEQQEKTDMIVNALRSYGVEIAEVKATIGPTVTLFEIVPAEGVKIAKIKNLEDDIAMNLAALGIRIIAPMPGKGTIGIEVPNSKPQIVGIRAVLESEAYEIAKEKMALPMALGATISNDIYIADLTKMPHLLVAGATGMGKSVGLNTIIMSLLYAKHPSELKFVLIDPKRVEFSVYKSIENHYMAKLADEDNAIITDPMKAAKTLLSLCEEMENRYDLLSEAGVRDIAKYNERFCQRRLNPSKGHRYLPYIVIIVDEFADLTMVAGKDVSLPIARIAQKARAVGMHMILATQRPSTDVITGMIKANFPGRIAFRVQQMVDSRTILDTPGANRLIGRGDMLFSNSGQMERVQCALVETEEIEDVVDCISNQIGYSQPYPLPEPKNPDGTIDLSDIGDGGPVEINKKDETFIQCARFVGTQNVASTSMLQRKFKIGFNRAGRIMEDLQALGIVGPPNGQNPRQVLMTLDEVENVLNNL